MPSTSDTIRRPWNLGRLIGPKPPFKPKHIWAIRTRLQGDWLFPSRSRPGEHLTTRQYGRLVESG